MPRGFAELYDCILCRPATLIEAEVATRAVDLAAQHGLRGQDIRVGAMLGIRLFEERLANRNAAGPEAIK